MKHTPQPKRKPDLTQPAGVSSNVLLLLVFGISVISLIISIAALSIASDLNNSLPQQISSGELLQKLASHEESKPFANQTPVSIIQITKQNFNSLQNRIEGLDESYLNDYIVEFSTGLMIYDFENDKLRGSLQYQQSQLPSDFFAKLSLHAEAQGLENQQPVGGILDASTLATLQQQFPDVYKNAKAGDALLRYQTKLIIYDYNADRIVNSVPLGLSPS